MPKRKKPPEKRRIKARHFLWAILPAVLLVFLVEVGLRLAGFGYPTSFFIPAGDGFVKSNERFAWRFMSPELARDPLPLRLAIRKAPGTIRIFVLGESEAQHGGGSAAGELRKAICAHFAEELMPFALKNEHLLFVPKGRKKLAASGPSGPHSPLCGSGMLY